MVKTHPIIMSVRFTVRANSPVRVGPQWGTVSASTSSPALRMVIELRSNAPGFVVEIPHNAL